MGEADLAPFDNLRDLGARPGVRLSAGEGLHDALGAEGRLTRLMQGIRDGDRAMQAVRVVSFNKSIDENWGVPWHQDRVVAVGERHEVDGFSNWSCKGGVWHCESPQVVLNEMLFVRVHLDDAEGESGNMEIALNSHRLGKVASQDAARAAQEFEREVCYAKRGDVLVLEMLTLHRSLPSKSSTPRRVFRLDYSAAHLPEPLVWAK